MCTYVSGKMQIHTHTLVATGIENSEDHQKTWKYVTAYFIFKVRLIKI